MRQHLQQKGTNHSQHTTGSAVLAPGRLGIHLIACNIKTNTERLHQAHLLPQWPRAAHH
jgi:hypothetical protein